MITEKRKLPRFHITPCQFHSVGAANEAGNKNFSVQDISLGGLSIRLVERTDLPQFAVGTEHQGLIKVEGLKTECTFIVKYLRGTLIGAEWVKPSDALKQHLTQILSPQRLGESLKGYPVPDSPNLIWFHTPVGVDLLLYKSEEDPGKLSRWILYFHQTFLQWESGEGLKTGQTLAEDAEGYAHGIVRLETRLLEYDAKTDRRLLETARDFIGSANGVEEGVRTMIKQQIEGALAG